MKLLVLFPLCCVDLPDTSKRNNKCFPIWGIHLHTEKKETGRKRERERGKISKNYSFESWRAERKGREVNFKRGAGDFRETDNVFPN